jgi:tRNA G18 (ribose-2'-O)-methylase SpoU
MTVMPITDGDDGRLEAYRVVADPVLARERGCFVAEGREVVRRLVEDRPGDVESILISPSAHDRLRRFLATRIPDVPVYVASVAVMRSVTGFNFHRGCLALARRHAPADWAEVVDPLGEAFVVVAESLANPDNLGALFRNAQALGAAAVLLSPGCTDPLYRKAIRTSMGATLALPWAWARPWPGTLEALRARGFHVVALTPSADADPIDGVLRGGRARLALLVGNEGRGLSDAALSRATRTVRIPQADGTDSLNVATAAAIAFYLAGRGRGLP